MSKILYNPEKIVRIIVRRESYTSYYYSKGFKLFGLITIMKPGFRRFGDFVCSDEKGLPDYVFVRMEEGKPVVYHKPEVNVRFQDGLYQDFYSDTFEGAMKKAEEIKMKSEVKLWIEVNN